ncbi:MAG: alginate lyase family protein [Deltaproteobacteria bacterium]|nr:alginate lyase family protein [Deltaproteobacteria bacterium]
MKENLEGPMDLFLHLYKLLWKSDYIRKEMYNYIAFILQNSRIYSGMSRIKRGLYKYAIKNNIPLHYQKKLWFRDYSLDLLSHGKIEPFYIRLPVQIANKVANNGKNEKELEAELASVKVTLKRIIEWNKRFIDKEDLLSLHRFGWILPILANLRGASEVQLIIDILIDWIEGSPCKEGTAGWDSYSISERLVNWIFILSVVKSYLKTEEQNLRKIINSLGAQAEVLGRHLEFRGSATNNHLIQNARALYLSGIFLRNRKLMDCGKEILVSECRNMFTPSGFLREGSSHYHILLCRTYLEVLWFGLAAGDHEFCDKIRDRVKDMYKCARFFLDYGKLPLFGDVSPDYPPEFHLGLTDVGDAIFKEDKRVFHSCSVGWHSFFVKQKDKDEGIKIGPSGTLDVNDKDVIAFPDSGYYRFKNENYCIFVYVNPLGYVPEWSHGHSDIGGFVLYWDGEPIFVDVGRPTYDGTKLGTYARSVRSHNAISIDRFEPCVTHALNGFTQIMINDYFQRPPQVRVEKESRCIRIDLEYYGYRRIKKDLVVKRTFSFYNERLTIEDSIEGKGKHLVETFFHMNPGVTVINDEKDHIVVRTKRGNLLRMILSLEKTSSMDILKGKDDSQPAGWFFPRYGKIVPTHTVIFSQNRELPLNNRYIIGKV